MPYYPNPAYGYTPGAPQATHRWIGNQFVLSDLPPVPPPPVPPVSTAATVTPQDVATQVGAGMLAPQPGGTGGSGGPGGGPGGLGGASGGGQDTTTSGYQGVYAQSPVDLESRFGEAGGLIGAGAGSLSGIPGIGTGLGFAGGMIDAGRINDTMAQYGLPGHVNPWGAGFAQALAGIGVPFTDLNLARAFGVPTAQQRLDAIIADAAPGLYNGAGAYGAMAANAQHSPGAPFGNTGWAAGMNPTTSQYPPGFLEEQARLDILANPDVFGAGASKAAAQGSAAWTGLGPQDKSNVDPNDFGGGGKGGGTADQGGGGKGDAAPGGSGGTSSSAGSGGSSREGGEGASKGGGGDKGGGDRDTGFYRGGLIGPPPGRYAAGGAVGRAGGEAEFQSWIRSLPWFREFVQQYGEEPNLRDPDYNYRRAHRAGIEPERYAPDANRYHWPSVTEAGDELKGPNHPTRWMEDFVREHGRDPNEMDAPYQQGVAPGAYAAGGAVRGVMPPAVPGDNITPAQFGLLRSINPPGPDDQIGALQTGEGVITKRAMGKGWGGLLGPINTGKLDPAKIKGLLAVVPAKPRRPR